RVVASYISAVHDPPLLPDFAIGCETVVLRPTHRTMPIDLLPTQLQMNTHILPGWTASYLFNHRHFLEDLVGDRVYLHPLPAQSQRGPVQHQVHSSIGSKMTPICTRWEGTYPMGRPHLKENWEATARFLTKWSWAVEGCRELVDIANKWRTTRGEHLSRYVRKAATTGFVYILHGTAELALVTCA
ncbi:hypothetical protein B0J15DRAFT_498508, partial [Fusarium solani]